MGNKIATYRRKVNQHEEFFGLFDADKKPLLLTDIKVEATVINSISEVRLIQTYKNTTGENQEVFYYFPISTSASFSSFEAEY